jgi:hypothetical protein
MLNCSESLRSGRAARCAVCDGKFGLVRYYSRATVLLPEIRGRCC